ncbi:hypothetical protein [Scardovia wiggsiae]|uniref:hypothetical protein n=1 Tax=Scardovia wiggsiae TaxID=230143 RepID=UPI00374FD43E
MNKPTPSRTQSINEYGAMVGDILVAMWGYEQTNWDYYKVIKVTAKTVTLEELKTGKIYKSKHTNNYSLTQDEYSVKILPFITAHYNPNDPQGDKARQQENEYWSVNAGY